MSQWIHYYILAFKCITQSSNVLFKNIDRHHTCHMKCRDMVSYQCVFSSVLKEHNAVRKSCPTSCSYKVFLQPVSAFILSKFYYSSWLNWYISKSKLFEHLDNIIQLEEFFTFVASMFLSWLCIFIFKLVMIFFIDKSFNKCCIYKFSIASVLKWMKCLYFNWIAF